MNSCNLGLLKGLIHEFRFELFLQLFLYFYWCSADESFLLVCFFHQKSILKWILLFFFFLNTLEVLIRFLWCLITRLLCRLNCFLRLCSRGERERGYFEGMITKRESVWAKERERELVWLFCIQMKFSFKLHCEQRVGGREREQQECGFCC